MLVVLLEVIVVFVWCGMILSGLVYYLHDQEKKYHDDNQHIFFYQDSLSALARDLEKKPDSTSYVHYMGNMYSVSEFITICRKNINVP